ncbi:MAG: helix-turn-helix domain-containing protein [Bifidobacteriaceae bacterium]|nr:helix-turn-helix domain-containing protein [Bifidobacteriaceae bacterium]
MSEWNAIAALDIRSDAISDDQIDAIINEVAEYHPALGSSLTGEVEVTVTFPATSLTQAMRTAAALLAPLGAIGLEVLPTTLFDLRLGLSAPPPMTSVSDAAATLGVSRQAVLQRIKAGALPAVRIGKAWAIPAAALTR